MSQVAAVMIYDYECEGGLLPNGEPCAGEEEESIKEAYHEEHGKLLTAHPWSHSEFRIARPLGVALKPFTPFGSPPARRIHPDVRDRKFVLDLGTGTGQTLSYLMVRFQEVNYKPTEWAAGGVESKEYTDAKTCVQDYSFAEAVNFKATARNMLPVDFLDPADAEWTSVEVPPPDTPQPMRKYDGVMATNLVQYLPMSTVESIFKGAARVLKPDGNLFLYGPFSVDGLFRPGWEAYDSRIRKLNPEWGVRDAKVMEELASASRLQLLEKVDLDKFGTMLLVFNRMPDCSGPPPPPPFFEAYTDPTAGFRGRQLQTAAMDQSAFEQWLEGWHSQFECFWTALPLPSQAQFGSCLGALALHLGSRFDGLLGRAPAQSSAAPEAGCEWLKEGAAELQQIPDFPSLPSNFKLEGGGSLLPAIPRLVPTWERLTSLVPAHRAQLLASVPAHQLHPADTAATPTGPTVAATAIANSPHQTSKTVTSSAVMSLSAGAGAGFALATMFVIYGASRRGILSCGKVRLRH